MDPSAPWTGGRRPLDLPLAYPVYVGNGLRDSVAALVQQHAPAHRYAVLSDTTVGALHASAIEAALPSGRARLFTIPPGESEKTRERSAQLTDALLAWGAGRDTTVVAVGGGVIGDLAGFVAATFMRGVPVVQVPTTLLAMVDASVGGKTGVDSHFGKNLVGAFHDPSAVVMALDTLATLPAPALRSGFAEILKHGIIADAAYLGETRRTLRDLRPALEAGRPVDVRALEAAVAGSVRIKATVVHEDTREGGRRQILNFGHTIAHAVETLLDYTLLHGDAVAMGMVAEARIAELVGVASPGLAATVAELLAEAGLPVRVPASLSADAMLEATRSDKKARDGAVRYALPADIGRMSPGDGRWSVPVPDAVVRQALQM